MIPSLPAPLKALLLCTLLALALAACGVRGPLEPPPNPGAPTTAGDPAAAGAGRPASPFGVSRGRRAPIVPPKEPFILDPIL